MSLKTRLGKPEVPAVTVFSDDPQTITSTQTLNAPLQFGSSSTPTVNGQIGYNGTNLLFREGGTNKTLSSGGGSFSGDVSTTSQGYLNNSTSSTPVEIRDTQGLKLSDDSASVSATVKVDGSFNRFLFDSDIRINTGKRIGIGSATSSHLLLVLYNNQPSGEVAFQVSGDLANNASTEQKSVYISSVSLSTGSGNNVGIRADLGAGAGYSGSGPAWTMYAVNSTGSSGTNVRLGSDNSFPIINVGYNAYVSCSGKTAGVYAEARGGTTNFGVIGKTLSAATTNVAVLGTSGNATSNSVGGYFALGQSDAPSFTTAALIADNGSVSGSSSSSVFLARVNGTTKFSIDNTGLATADAGLAIGSFTPTVNGQIGYNGTNFLFREAGTNRTIGQDFSLNSSTAPFDQVTNTTTKTAFASGIVIPASAIQEGDIFRAFFGGVMSWNPATTINFEISDNLSEIFGPSLEHKVPTFTLAGATLDYVPWWAELDMRFHEVVPGNGMNYVATLRIYCPATPSGSGGATTISIGAGGNLNYTGTINVASAHTIKLNITWGAATTSNVISQQYAYSYFAR